jgi:hypothetical protein
MTMIAYAYLQSRRLAEASGGKNSPRAAQADAARDPAPFSLARGHIDVPIAAEPSQDASNKSAKVVLGRL